MRRRANQSSTAKHRLPVPGDASHRVVQRIIEMVDTGNTAHFLTMTAAETGRASGRYTALCAEEIVPAAMVARAARYCRLCAPQ